MANIAVLAVGENKLSEWVKNSKITFPVGRITADIEKTRFTWGVRSLPWLSLIGSSAATPIADPAYVFSQDTAFATILKLVISIGAMRNIAKRRNLF